LKLVTWNFKNGKNHVYDKSTFKKKVKQLLYRVKPQGFSLLTLDFTKNSESVYVIFVSNKSNNAYMFRISSHETFGESAFWTYNTVNYSSFKSLEAQIQKDLKNRNSNLSFTFESEDYLFYLGITQLHKQKKILLVEKHFFKRNFTVQNKKRLFIKNRKHSLESVVFDEKCLDLVLKMLEKGYLNGNPINPIYSEIIVTPLFHQLAKHYKHLFASQSKKIDFNSYFDSTLDKKNLLVKQDFNATEKFEAHLLWEFKEQYFIGNFENLLQQTIEEIMPSTLKLLSFSFNQKEKLASVFFILKETPNSYLNLVISSQKVKLLYNYKAFRSCDYENFTAFESDISYFLQTIQISMFKRLKSIDYQVLKWLLRLEKKKKLVTISEPLTNETLSSLKEICLVIKKQNLREFLFKMT